MRLRLGYCSSVGKGGNLTHPQWDTSEPMRVRRPKMKIYAPTQSSRSYREQRSTLPQIVADSYAKKSLSFVGGYLVN
jgi:hypothetical protein